MRAGVWKPRTRPGTFEGNGEDALKWIADIKEELGVQFTVEVANTSHIELALKYGIDILWIGARTTVNQPQYKRLLMLLKEHTIRSHQKPN